MDFVEFGEGDVQSNELDFGGVARDSHAVDPSALIRGEEVGVWLAGGLEGELEVVEEEAREFLERVEAGWVGHADGVDDGGW